jgi:Imidazolonepropionase and related amidohydrolases
MNHLLRSRFLVLGLLPTLLACAVASAQQNQLSGSSLIEQGKFTLHKFEQAIGEETYEIHRDGDVLSVKMDFKFIDRGSPVPLTATFHAAQDLTPQAFEIKGRTARPISIDQAINIDQQSVHLRTRDKQTEIAVPAGAFFTIAGYAPSTMQMLMVRYWATHGSPPQLATLPSGFVKIEPRGQDLIHVGTREEKLDRFTVEGLIWGRETLWFDANRNLVAAITTDAEFDHFEAIRDGYESALGDFVGRAGADGMAALAEISKQIPGSHAPILAIVGATLIDGTGSAPIPDAAVVIRKGRIIGAGPRSKIKIPRHASIVEAHGKTILPGLWDMHAHFEQVEGGLSTSRRASRRSAIAAMSSNSSPQFAMPSRRAAVSALAFF